MTLPYTHTSRIQKKAKVRGILLDSGKYQELLPLYFEVISEIYTQLYDEDLDDLAKNEGFVRAIATDIRLIVKGLSKIGLTFNLKLISTSGRLEDAQVELSVLKGSYDDPQVGDIFATIRGRTQALKNFRRTLYKVIIYWPREWKKPA